MNQLHNLFYFSPRFWASSCLGVRNVLAPSFWRRCFGADVLAPLRFGAARFGAIRFGAEHGRRSFWRQVWAPDVLAPSMDADGFGAKYGRQTFWR